MQIIQALEQWPKDFNSKNIRGACGLFAPDLIASYPGTSDRNYSQMCEKLTQSMADSNTSFQYDAPEIEQIIIKDNIAVVRLIWTSRITDKNQAAPLVIREKGLDIFQKQSDGAWKIRISYAYPIE